MNKHEIITFISILVLLVGAIFINANNVSNKADSPDSPPTKDDDNKSDTDDSKTIIWGVDSASYTDESLYRCVVEHFGQPKIWGRYLGDIEGVSAGLDTEEVSYLQENDIHILVIYNHFSDATGYDHGVKEAKQAISFAEDLDIPEGVAIFGDIEPDYPVDSAFIEGWYDTLSDSIYEPALYGVFNEDSPLIEAYNTTNQDTQENIVIWTAYPQEKITTQENAPTYHPQGPNNSLLYGWQYAIDAKQCNIDTNLFSDHILDYVW